MSTEILTLHVERSDDGLTEFARLSDILDCLAHQYGWHPDVYSHLTVLVAQARRIDQVYKEYNPPKVSTRLHCASLLEAHIPCQNQTGTRGGRYSRSETSQLT